MLTHNVKCIILKNEVNYMKNAKEVTDKELLAEAVYDDEAFAKLYRKYHNLVYFVAYKMCQNESDAQDILQETFIEIRRSLKNLRNPQFFRLWLYRVIDSKCKKLYRQNKYSLTDIEQDHIQNSFLERKQQHLPADTARFQNDQELLMHMVKELPYDQKFAIILYYFEQMTTLEISEVLDVPEGTIKSRLSVARTTLRKKITAYENREHIKLDFHDLSGALTLAFTATMTKPIISSIYQNKGASTAKGLKTSFVSTKVIAGVTASILTPTIAFAGYTAWNQHQLPNSSVINQEQAFPTLIYQGKELTSEIEAYYTLKQSACHHDLTTLTQQEREELNPLYEALKEKRGIFYERLQESGWSDLYEK